MAVNKQCSYYPVNLLFSFFFFLSHIHQRADASLLVCPFTERNFILVSGLW